MKTKRIVYLFCLMLGFMLSNQAHSQTLTLNGSVKDESGNPLPGVSIQVKGTSVGTATNGKGEFSIKADAGKTLIVSFIGYVNQEIAIKSAKSLNIVMKEDSKKLDEVVVVGYGTQKKANLTGAVATVNKDVFENRAISSPAVALQGAMPGVTVTRSSGAPGDEGLDIEIRGATSLSGSSVLVIVDGVPGSLSALNPQDIDNISVLKDAAASAIYGARAAGGVILVTTKKGIKGKVKVNYSSLFGVTTPANMVERLNSWEEAEMENWAATNAGLGAPNSQDIIEKLKDPNLIWELDPSNPSDPKKWAYYDNTDWVKAGTKKYSNTQNHNLSVSGGNDNTTYMLSLGYYQRDGILKYGPDSHERYNVRLNLNTRFSKYFNLQTNLAYRNSQTLSPSLNIKGDYGMMYLLYNLRSRESVYDPNGGYNGSVSNPLAFMKEGGKKKDVMETYDANANLTIENIIPNLKVNVIASRKVDFGNEWTNKRTINYYGPQSNIIKTDNKTNSLIVFDERFLNQSVQAFATYNLNLKDAHKFGLIAGYSFEDYRYVPHYSSISSIQNNELFALNLGDPATGVLNPSQNTLTSAFMSGFGRFNYSYKDKYLFEANVRVDGSSRLQPNDRWSTFPSFSAAWRISSEPIFQKAFPFVSDMKVRASLGRLGNYGASQGYYDFLTQLYPGTIVLNNQKQNFYYEKQLASPLKSWETIETRNVGVDISLFNNKLSATGEIYIKTNDEMLISPTRPSTIGINLSKYNIGKLETKGWELSLKWTDRIKNFKYWVNANISDSKNKLVKYEGRTGVALGVNGAIEGMPLNTVWGYKTDGIFKTKEEYLEYGVTQHTVTSAGDIKYLDLNGDGKINVGDGNLANPGDLVMLGTTDPRYNFGVNLGCEWKGIDFSAVFQGVGKRAFVINDVGVMPLKESWRMPNAIHRDYWTPENTDAYWPRLYRNGTHNFLTSDKWVQNGAYIRLKNIQLGYTLPKSIINKVKLDKVRVYLSGQDLWENSNVLSILDPETPSNSDFVYPFFRVVSCGININF